VGSVAFAGPVGFFDNKSVAVYPSQLTVRATLALKSTVWQGLSKLRRWPVQSTGWPNGPAPKARAIRNSSMRAGSERSPPARPMVGRAVSDLRGSRPKAVAGIRLRTSTLL